MALQKFGDFSPRIDPTAYVADTALIIGQVQIGKDSSIWPMTVVRGDIHRITIGSRTNIQDGSVVHVTRVSENNPQGFPVIIGDDVTIGHRVILHACTLESHCLIGMGAIVLDGAHVESHVLVGAGSLVPPGKRLESGYLWLGAPVRKVRVLTAEELQHLQQSSADYVQLKDAYLKNL